MAHNDNANGQEKMQFVIQTVLSSHQAAWNSGDIDGLLDGYTKTDALRYASGGDVLRGFSAVRQRFMSAYPDRAAMGTLSFSDIEVEQFTDSDAIAFGRWRIERASAQMSGLFTLQFCKSDGHWLIATDHTSIAT